MARSKRPSRRPTLEESAELDEVVREAAVATFLEHGFNGTTMDVVARTAGITRQTLYARYSDKRALFVDVIRRALLHDQHDESTLGLDDDLASSLMTIARSAMSRAVDPETIRLSVLLMNESPRFPDLVPKDHHLTRHPHGQSVIEVLRRHRDAGTVAVEDLELAAEQFLTMVASHPARLAAFGLRRSPESEERYLEHAVNLFINGVGTRQGNGVTSQETT